MSETVLFDRYRLLEHAGIGGSAQVWRALDLRTGDTVAVKRLHPIVLSDPAARRRLQRESRTLDALDHPNVVAVRDLHADETEAALVLDFVDGQSLAERLATEPPPAVGEVVSIVRDVASALTAAHAVGIVHRDVKPGNIILATDGRAMLTDFGIAADETAAATQTAGGPLTATGTIVGTFRYMAPEQLRGATAAPASDQYALAAVAYEMLAGRPPYAAATPVALAEEQAAPPPPIAGIRPELDAAVRRGLAADPAGRHADVAAFAAAVAGAMRASSAAWDTDVATVVPVAARAAEPGAAAGLGAAGVAAAVGDHLLGDPRSDPAPRPAAVQTGPVVVRRAARARPRWVPLAAVAALLLGGAVVLTAIAGGLDGGVAAAPSRTPTVTSTPAPETPTPAPRVAPAGGGGNDEKDDDKRQDDDRKDDEKKDGNKGKGDDKGKGND